MSKIIFLFLILIVESIFPNTSIAASIEQPINVSSQIEINQSFSVDSSITGTQSGEVYFVKCRVGPSSSSLTEGQTLNSQTNSWLSDTNSWTDMPTVNAISSTVNFSIQCKVKSDSSAGQKFVYTRACLKKSDGTCGTSFQSSSGMSFTASAATTTTVTPTVTTTPTTSPSPTSAPASSFTISSAPSKINSDQSFSVKISLILPSNPDTIYYLKGAFKKSDGTRYLGLTKKGSDWIEYGDDYTDQNKITTDGAGQWSGDLEVKPDIYDNDYKGSGEYNFKVGRYTSGGSGPSWSNDVSLTLTETAAKAGGTTQTVTSTLTALPSKISSPTPQHTPNINPAILGASLSATITPTEESETIEVKSEKQINYFAIAGGVLTTIGLGILTFIFYKYKLQ